MDRQVTHYQVYDFRPMAPGIHLEQVKIGPFLDIRSALEQARQLLGSDGWSVHVYALNSKDIVCKDITGHLLAEMLEELDAPGVQILDRNRISLLADRTLAS